MGLGNYTRANSEICLIGKKGKGLPVLSHAVPQILDMPLSEHSEKPDEARKRIIQLVGDLPRIELFARTKIHGWDTFGNDQKLELEPLEFFT
jgi:N6-adenosine-specific RNA methylase IME4